MELGPLMFEGHTFQPGTRLAIFIVAGIVVSLVGFRFAAYVSSRGIEEELAPGRETTD
jgi:putative membrane protein